MSILIKADQCIPNIYTTKNLKIKIENKKTMLKGLMKIWLNFDHSKALN